MKKYVLMIAMGSLLCMAQVQASEDFKNAIVQDIGKKSLYAPAFGLKSYNVTMVANQARKRAIEERIDFGAVVPIVIDQLMKIAVPQSFGLVTKEMLLNDITKLVMDAFYHSDEY